MTPERWKRIEDLFHAALATAPATRDAFLDTACSDDRSLREEIESLLSEAASKGILDQSEIIAPPLIAEIPEGRHAGRLLGSYQLQTLLGSGGMGEVYLAHDTKLGRNVAIKVLPHEFISDPDRLARFEREARMLATVNHPNICGIYGLDESEGIRFLVLELVPGHTLAALLAETGAGLPAQSALEIVRQIAAALEAAHDRGIVHRDLKPSNIKISPTYIVKVLDFGLAKAVGGSQTGPELTQVRETSDGAFGLRLGTAAYMSPEQARGLPVDKRADIWAFGVVFFELLSGKRPFTGDSATDIVAAVLKSDVEWEALPAHVTPGMRRLLVSCLQKDRRRRLQSIADARVTIESLQTNGDDEYGAVVTSRGSKPRQGIVSMATSGRVGWIAAAMVTAALAATLLLTPRTERRLQFPALPPTGASLVTEEAPAISPDGSTLAYVAYDAGRTQRIYLFTIGSGEEPTLLPKSEGASQLFWAPDSRAIGFFAQGRLKTIDVVTRAPRDLGPAFGPRGGTWNAGGVIAFVPNPREGPHRVAAAGDGADVQPIQAPSGRSPGGWFPAFLPDGGHILEFQPTTSQPENAGVWIVSLASGKRERLMPSLSNAIYSQGHLLFWQEGTLWAQAFDERRRQLRGTPMQVADHVGLNPVTNQALFSVSATGVLTYLSDALLDTELVWVDRDGQERGRPGARGLISTLALAPDERSVVYDQADPVTTTFDLWRLVFGQPTPARLTVNPSNDVFPLFAPDGTSVAFMSVRERPPQVHVMRPDAAGTERRLFQVPFPILPSGWSSDSRTLFATVANPKTGGDIAAYSLDTAGTRTILNTGHDERYATPSPDGRWLAYTSNQSGLHEVYVLDLHNPTAPALQVSAGGGSQPQWRRDGLEIVYLALDRTLMSVTVDARGETLTKGAPQALFPTRIRLFEVQGTTRAFAMSRDGRRFLLANATMASGYAHIQVVQNWLAGLRR